MLHGDAVPAQVSMVEKESTLRFLCFSFVWKAASPRSAATLWCYDNFVVNTYAFSICVTWYNTDTAGDGCYQKYDKTRTWHERSET